jgi:hypothetical protein
MLKKAKSEKVGLILVKITNESIFLNCRHIVVGAKLRV